MYYKKIWPISIGEGEGVRVVVEVSAAQNNLGNHPEGTFFSNVSYGEVYRYLNNPRIDGLTIKIPDDIQMPDSVLGMDDWEDISALCSNMKMTPGLGEKSIWIWTNLPWDKVPLFFAANHVKVFACSDGNELIDARKSIDRYERKKLLNPVKYIIK